MQRTLLSFDKRKDVTPEDFVSQQMAEACQKAEHEGAARELQNAVEDWARREKQGRRLTASLKHVRRLARPLLRRVNQKNPPNEYRDVVDLLRGYITQKINGHEVSQQINKALAKTPTVWTVKWYAYGKPSHDRFELDWDSGGVMTPWKQLALLIGEGFALDRLRVCALDGCGMIFPDTSPNRQGRYCTEKHRLAANSRAYRTRHSRKDPPTPGHHR